jgi:hypothetical protein
MVFVGRLWGAESEFIILVFTTLRCAVAWLKALLALFAFV